MTVCQSMILLPFLGASVPSSDACGGPSPGLPAPAATEGKHIERDYNWLTQTVNCTP